MATYKVIQDIEAEDKFVGPLTLKQFVFAMGGSFFAWVCFFLVTKQLAWATILFAPISLFGFFMAFPWSKEQQTDVWVLAKIQFHLKPKKRIWNQAGRQDLVTITAPKKIEKHLTKDFSETEVKSRLKALAETIDSRGWVVKHATATEAAGPVAGDRLIDLSTLPQPVEDDREQDLPDIMENSRFGQLLDKSDDQRREKLMDKIDQARQKRSREAKTQPVIKAPEEDVVAEQSKNAADRIDEMLLSQQVRNKRTAGDVAYSHMSKVPASSSSKPNDTDDDSTVQPEAAKKPTKKDTVTTEEKNTSTVTDQISPDILGLARNNDLKVATIARQANKDRQDDDEVVISLH